MPSTATTSDQSARTIRVAFLGSGTIAVGRAGRAAVIDGVHTVFLVTTPIALLALIAVIAIKEVPLRGAGKPQQHNATPEEAASSPPAPAAATR
jgi:hypothetical protein